MEKQKVKIKDKVPNRGFKGRLRGLLIMLLGVMGVGFLFAVIMIFVAVRDLPQLSGLDSYRPLLPLKIYSSDGTLIGEYGEQIREIVPIERIPKRLREAFVASEDSAFYHHFGINPLAIIRAAWANLKAGHIVQGGSTITQQVAKTFFLSPKRTFKRKLQEAILAIEIEQNFSKDEILWLYCNQIYLGHGAYGVAAAARNYFRKDLQDLTLAEIAYIAGLPKAPNKYSPWRNPKLAKRRQKYVLRRMMEEGFITEQEMEQALRQDVKLYPVPDSHSRYAPYYAEQARRNVLDLAKICVRRFEGLPDPKQPPDAEELLSKLPPEKWGDPFPKKIVLPSEKFCNALRPYYDDMKDGEEDIDWSDTKDIALRLIYRSGLRVFTAADLSAEFLAQDAILYGLKRITKRMGYIGPAGHLEKSDWKRFFKVYDSKYPNPSSLRRDGLYPGMVVRIEDDGEKAWVRIGKIEAPIYLSDTTWARKPKPEVRWEYDKVKDLHSVFKVGDLIVVRPSDRRGIVKADDFRSKAALPEDPKKWHLDLIQWPYPEASFMLKDINTGYILAMIGGWNYEESQLNRTMQACRQPGSSFKPIVYTTALEKGWTPATIIVDSPVVTQDSRMRWTPSNYGQTFYGDTPLVKGLALSRNICAIKALQFAGITDVISWARKLGITTRIAEDFSIALGSSCVIMDELTQAYMHFPRLGKRPRKVLITHILDAHGNLLEDFRAPSDPWLMPGTDVFSRLTYDAEHKPKQVLPPDTAYIMIKLMQQVVETGTAVAAKSLERPLAGKTGTTNDSFDAWFTGYTPSLIASAWVGFDNYERHFGRGETGGSAALPIFIDFMRRYLVMTPPEDFPEAPEGIEWATIDFDHGYLASSATMHRVRMPFKKGTAPRERYNPGEEIKIEDFDKDVPF